MTKKILHLRGSSALLGAERVVLELSRWSSPFGYEPLVVAPNESGAATPEFITAAVADGIAARTLRCDGRLDWSLPRRLRQLVRSEGIDIVHCHGYKEDFYAAIAGLGVPLIATNHLWKRTTRALRVYCRVDGMVLRRFDQVIAVSDPIVAELKASGLPADRLMKIPNGIDCERLAQPLTDDQRAAVRHSLGLRDNAVVVGMLSSLSVEKGHAFALEAIRVLAREFGELQLCIVGDGGLRSSLQEQVVAHGLGSRVIFAGRRSDITQVLGAFDVFALPSLSEGLPMALLEAMASGLPAVASAVGDVGQLIENRSSGLLVPAGDSAALAAALRELIVSPELRRRLGTSAQRRVGAHFSSRAMTQAYCQVYDRQLQASPAGLTCA